MIHFINLIVKSSLLLLMKVRQQYLKMIISLHSTILGGTNVKFTTSTEYLPNFQVGNTQV